MAQMHQIHEENLGELEQLLPQLAEAMTPMLTNRLRVKLRRCQSILSDVRWNYGPPRGVEVVSEDDDFED